jgi:toxin ParE1/3/4
VTLRFHPDVQRELRDLSAWHEERRDGLGTDLRDEVMRALNAIAEHPNRWALSSFPKARALGVRHFLIRRFRLSIEYTTDERTILIVAVAHMSRRPGYWMRRMHPSRR